MARTNELTVRATRLEERPKRWGRTIIDVRHEFYRLERKGSERIIGSPIDTEMRSLILQYHSTFGHFPRTYEMTFRGTQ